jgi:hypothetical protein
MPARGIKEPPHDLAVIVDAKGLGAQGAGDINGGDRVAVSHKAMPPCGITEHPHDLAAIVDVKG